MKGIEGNIYTKDNPYELKYQVNHPWVNKLYTEYCKQVSKAFWWYPLEDLERLRFECLLDNVIKRSGEEKEKCEEYFYNVLKSLKRLDFDRIRANKKTDCLTIAKIWQSVTKTQYHCNRYSEKKQA